MLRALALWFVGQLITREQVLKFVSYLAEWLKERAHESDTLVDDEVIEAVEDILTQPEVLDDLVAWLDAAIRGKVG